MEIIGDDKKLRALYSETRFVDEEVVPNFSATWYRAQSRAKQPRRTFNFAFASALALVIFAVATLAIWSKYSPQQETYSAFAIPTAAKIVIASKGNPEVPSPAIDVKYPSLSRKSRASKLAAQRQQLLVAENRKVQKEAKELASWQSPTASLLSSSSDDLFKSLPQLNQNANEMKSFLPNRSNDKEN
jgi:hypothetical protein